MPFSNVDVEKNASATTMSVMDSSFLEYRVHNADVIFNECFVSHIQRRVPYCMMGTQYHAFVVGNIQQADAHDFKSVLHSPCTSRRKTTKRLLIY